jgi:YVTN family beta-propeller protein
MKRFVTVTVGWLSILLCFATSALAGSVVTVPVGTTPKFVAVNQTTNLIYVSNIEGNSVSVIDGTTNTVVATVPVGEAPEALDVNPITNMVYVASYLGDSVSVIDGSSNTVLATITEMDANGVAVNSITNQVFISSPSTNSVAVIDGATNEIVATVTVGYEPMGVRVNSTTNLIYVSNLLSATISVIDGTNDKVTNTFTLPSFDGAKAEPNIIALDPITNRLFVVDGANEVVDVLDASTGTLLSTITADSVPWEPDYVAMFQPGKTILISDSSLGALLEVSESSYAVSAVLKGGSDPFGIGVNRKMGKIYVAEEGTNTVNVYNK